MRKISSLVSSHHSPRILDYGCGTGVLVERLLKNGYEVEGFEPSQSAVALAKKIHLPVYDDLRALSGSYALIMFWHSLEHTFNPHEVMAWCRPLLEEKGKILIAVPNASSWEARLAGEQWFHYDYPFHRIHFTPRAITKMLENVGFRVISIDYFNPEYTFSGLVQTFLNFFLPKNILYSVVANRRMSRSREISSFYGFVSLFAVALFSPVLLFLFFLELAAKKTGAMIVSAEKI